MLEMGGWVGGESVRGDYSKLRFYPGKGRKEGRKKKKKKRTGRE